jgi:hypothetical protein
LKEAKPSAGDVAGRLFFALFAAHCELAFGSLTAYAIVKRFPSLDANSGVDSEKTMLETSKFVVWNIAAR